VRDRRGHAIGNTEEKSGIEQQKRGKKEEEYMSKRVLILMCSIFLVVPLLFMGCSGDDGSNGINGTNGTNGINGSNGTNASTAFNLESCAICHDDQNVRNGDAHQADYDQRFQDNVVVVDNIAYTFIDNVHRVAFNMTKAGKPFNCTQTSTGAKDPRTGTTEDSLGILFAEYTAATRSFDPPAPLPGRLSLGTQGSASTPSTLSWTESTNLCTSTVIDNITFTDDPTIYHAGDLSERNGIIVVYGRDDVNGALASPARVVLSVFPFAGLSETGTTGAVDYVSAANVTGCEKCHTVPYLKHGYIYGRVGGVAATDFYTCKGCHMDNARSIDEPVGGHLIWQLLVDNPQLAAAIEKDESLLTPALEVQYAYRTRLMNDVHMSHAMEFAYPQSMANCATCHEGKLASAVLTDNNFVIETCKSCHPVTGGTDLPDPDDGSFTVDTRTKNPLNKQAPALASILPSFVGAPHAPPFATACNGCHVSGSVITTTRFTTVHTGYDKKIYGAPGEKYSEAITVTIDNASFVDNTLKFGFHATGSLGGVSSANITPTILVGLYGFDTKDFLFGPHETSGGRRLLEYNTIPPTEGTLNSNRITVTGGAGTWNVTADLSTWDPNIDNGSVKRVEVAVLPRLEHPDLPKVFEDDNVVALNAQSKTFNLKTNRIEDDPPGLPNPPAGHANDFFGNSLVRVQGGTVGGVMSGCNNCHDALATTFHTADRGGSVVVCRLCHITKAAGSHLELQSRSIDSYTHAIHRFQSLVAGDIDFTDPVEAMEYRHHVQSNFPTFGVENCRACHNAGKFNVPNQGLSLPGVLSDTDFNTARNIVAVDNLITGPATRACGACHRAEAIIANAGFGDPIKLANINSHMATFGYMIKTPPANILDVIFQIFSMFGEEGIILAG
jgi:OmcA/MtrC family decaheme c-type cytochrome